MIRPDIPAAPQPKSFVFQLFVSWPWAFLKLLGRLGWALLKAMGFVFLVFLGVALSQS